jgi:hypothetical protein
MAHTHIQSHTHTGGKSADTGTAKEEWVLVCCAVAFGCGRLEQAVAAHGMMADGVQ